MGVVGRGKVGGVEMIAVIRRTKCMRLEGC